MYVVYINCTAENPIVCRFPHSLLLLWAGINLKGKIIIRRNQGISRLEVTIKSLD